MSLKKKKRAKELLCKLLAMFLQNKLEDCVFLKISLNKDGHSTIYNFFFYKKYVILCYSGSILNRTKKFELAWYETY